MIKIKWTKDTFYRAHAETRINDFRVTRVTCASGVKHYYVHWILNPTWAAPHSRMSNNLPSLKAVRGLIEHLKTQSNCVSRLHSKLKAGG